MIRTTDPLVIGDIIIPTSIIGGGMGIGGTRPRYTRAFAKEGAIACLSSAAMRNLYSDELGIGVSAYDAVHREVSIAKEGGMLAGINIMVACAADFEASVIAAHDAQADLIMAGAGLPMSLPEYVPENSHTALVVIVSSGRALDLICRQWKKKYNRLPNAVYLEFPDKAGGHLGARIIAEIIDPTYSREKVFLEVLRVANEHGGMPVVVGGGIYTFADRVYWQETMGANGVVVATRFIATEECTLHSSYKEAVIRANHDDIIIVSPSENPPGSAGQLPLRISKESPFFLNHASRKPACRIGALLQRKDGKYTECPAKPGSEKCASNLCTCKGLMNSYYGKGDALWTFGTNAALVRKMSTVKDVMDKYKGIVPEDY